MKVGYQGVYGAYSSIASLNYFADNAEYIGYESFQTVVDALLSDDIKYGVFPVENSTTGQIYRTLDLLKYEDSFFAIGETVVEVNHNLIVFPDTKIEELRYVYSHPEALSQCLEFFKKYPHIKPVSYHDTATSVIHIKELSSKENGAIASSLAAITHNMTVLDSAVQDMSGNQTRFLIIKKVDDKNFINTSDNRNKLSCYFETKHESGELFKILRIFSDHNYNLLSLHSRSTKKNSFEYGFFADISITNSDEKELRSLIGDLKNNLLYFNLLGVYK